MSGKIGVAVQVEPDDLKRWYAVADFRGFRRNGTGNLAAWLRSLANAEVKRVEAEIAGGAMPAADNREVLRQIRRQAERRRELKQERPTFRLAPPCDHVPVGLWCDRCGERRRS